MTKTVRWFELRRREWIHEMLRIYGFINREHLQKKFGISVPQASLDLRTFMTSYPYAMHYDSHRKCYVSDIGTKAVRR